MYPVYPEPSRTAEDEAELALLRQENDGLRRGYEERDNQFLENLRTLPEEQALELFHRFRALAVGSNNVSRFGPILNVVGQEKKGQTLDERHDTSF